MTGQTMMIVGVAMVGIAIIAEIIMGIVFRTTKKRMIQKIFEESEYR